jgi:integrase
LHFIRACGLGKFFSLCWNDVDLEKGILSVRADKTGKIRNVPINHVTQKILNYWLLGRRNEFVFYNPDTGKQFRDLKAGFKSACKKAGISDVTWHTLR